MRKRKEAEEYILKYIGKIVKGGDDNVKLYQNLFKSMSDKEFDKFMCDLRDDKITLSVIIPNGGKLHVDIKNNYNIGKEIGNNFFQKLVIRNNGDAGDYKTPIEFLNLILPVRRASQLLSKKISVPSDTRHIDTITGQVTGDSKSSKITLPELQILTGLNLKESVKELTKVRGGDVGAGNAADAKLYNNGRVSISELEEHSTGVESGKTLQSYFNAAHIRTTQLTGLKK